MTGFGPAMAQALNGDATIANLLTNVMGGQNATNAGQEAGNGFTRGFSRVATGIGTAAVAALAIFSAAVTAAAAAGGIAIYQGVTDASNLEQARGAVEQVFGSSSAAIENFAATSAQAFGLSTRAALDGAKDLGIFAKVAGLTGTGLEGFTIDLLSLSADLSAFGNTSPEEALTALSSGLRGEAEPLRKYGILLDDATLKAQALSMGLYSGTGNLDAGSRILAAQASILAQSSTQMGQFGRESEGLAGQQAILASQIENSSAKLGAVFLPAFVAFFTFMNEKGIPIIDGLIGKFDTFIKGLVPEGVDPTTFFSGLFSGLTPILELFKELSPMFDLFDALVAKAPELAAAFAPVGATIRDVLLPALADIAVAIGPLVADVFGLIVDTLINFAPVLDEILKGLIPIIVQLVQFLARTPP